MPLDLLEALVAVPGSSARAVFGENAGLLAGDRTEERDRAWQHLPLSYEVVEALGVAARYAESIDAPEITSAPLLLSLILEPTVAMRLASAGVDPDAARDSVEQRLEDLIARELSTG